MMAAVPSVYDGCGRGLNCVAWPVANKVAKSIRTKPNERVRQTFSDEVHTVHFGRAGCNGYRARGRFCILEA